MQFTNYLNNKQVKLFKRQDNTVWIFRDSLDKLIKVTDVPDKHRDRVYINKKRHKLVSESYVYQLLVEDKSPIGVEFRDWVFDVLIPCVRKEQTPKLSQYVELFKVHPSCSPKFNSLPKYDIWSPVNSESEEDGEFDQVEQDELVDVFEPDFHDLPSEDEEELFRIYPLSVEKIVSGIMKKRKS